MKFEKVFNLSKEKDANKVYAALDNGYGREYLNAMLSEAQSANAMNLDKALCMLTSNYLVHFGNFKKSLEIIPTDKIVNVYMSNCFYGNYSYDTKAIAVELDDNTLIYVARHQRAQKPAVVTTLLQELTKRCAQNVNSLTA